VPGGSSERFTSLWQPFVLEFAETLDEDAQELLHHIEAAIKGTFTIETLTLQTHIVLVRWETYWRSYLVAWNRQWLL
jgi:hypothetical protein